MRTYQLVIEGQAHLVSEMSNNLYDITATDTDIRTILDALDASANLKIPLSEFIKSIADAAVPLPYSIAEVIDQSNPISNRVEISIPLQPPEVWCAGVTYRRSMEERKEESKTPDVYSRVYEADRPELFLKDSGHRTVGPFMPIGIRGDAIWSVPEPELACVIYGGSIVGFMAGNDVSSRDIEGANPLYLAQAKVYDRSCSIGPCFVPIDSIGDPQLLEISMKVERDSVVTFQGQTNTNKMVRSCQELSDWLNKHNQVPDGTVLLTGTGIVPPQDFTLEEGDSVSISIESIGVLTNDVVFV